MAAPPARLSRLTNRVKPPDAPGLSALLGLAVGVVIITALSVAREVLIPITLAVLLSFVLGPVVAAQRRIGIPRVAAVLVAAVLALAVVSMIGLLIGTQVAQLSTDLPRYASVIETKVNTVRGFAERELLQFANGLGEVGTQNAKPPATSGGAPAPPGPMQVEIHQPPMSPWDLAQTILIPVVSPLATMLIVFVVAIFVLVQREDLRDRFIRLFGSNDLHRTTAALDDAGSRLGRYYLSLLAVNTGFGALIGTGLFLIGIPSPVLWGILAGMLRFVPYIGAFGGAVFPMVLACAIDPGWTTALETAGLFLLIEPVLGQVFEPLIYGKSTGLSPVSVVISAIFWGWIWGGIGLLLSMPLTLCLVVLGKHIDRLEFLDVLLGDQPALSPPESLYQRMLVGDADEALEQAETQLKDRDLSQYYDEVAVPSLQLAANDSLRGVLTEEQLRGVMESICGVIVDLGTDAKAQPADPAQHGHTILCVAGRGALDEAVCSMLAQLLGQRGLRARVVPQHAVARANIAALDLADVDGICISYLEGANSLSPLRYLVRRLRQRAGDIPILAGLWGVNSELLAEDRLQAAIGADHYTRSLHDAVTLWAEGSGALKPQPVAEMS